MEIKNEKKFATELDQAGLSLAEFCRKTQTPYDTAQKWHAGSRRTPAIAFAWLDLYNRLKQTGGG